MHGANIRPAHPRWRYLDRCVSNWWHWPSTVVARIGTSCALSIHVSERIYFRFSFVCVFTTSTHSVVHIVSSINRTKLTCHFNLWFNALAFWLWFTANDDCSDSPWTNVECRFAWCVWKWILSSTMNYERKTKNMTEFEPFHFPTFECDCVPLIVVFLRHSNGQLHLCSPRSFSPTIHLSWPIRIWVSQSNQSDALYWPTQDFGSTNKPFFTQFFYWLRRMRGRKVSEMNFFMFPDTNSN